MAKRGKWIPGVSDVAVKFAVGQKLGLEAVGEMVLEESSARVPYQTKALMRSGQFVVNRNRVSIFYTDPKAVAVHEDAQSNFRRGREWKYLESAVNENAQEIYRALAVRLRGALGG